MIFQNIAEIVIEAMSGYNDGWTKKFYREKLWKIKELIDSVLKKTENGFEIVLKGGEEDGKERDF